MRTLVGIRHQHVSQPVGWVLPAGRSVSSRTRATGTQPEISLMEPAFLWVSAVSVSGPTRQRTHVARDDRIALTPGRTCGPELATQVPIPDVSFRTKAPSAGRREALQPWAGSHKATCGTGWAIHGDRLGAWLSPESISRPGSRIRRDDSSVANRKPGCIDHQANLRFSRSSPAGSVLINPVRRPVCPGAAAARSSPRIDRDAQRSRQANDRPYRPATCRPRCRPRQ
jgi:hypothetical protein